jgi:hypothetical protein
MKRLFVALTCTTFLMACGGEAKKSTDTAKEKVATDKDSSGVQLPNEKEDDDNPIDAKKLLSGQEASAALSKAFAEKVGGTGSWSDILKYVSAKTGKVADDVDVTAWIKTQPDLMKKIAMSSDEIVNSVIQKKFTTMNLDQLFSDDSIKFLEELSNETLDDITADYIKSTSENLVKFIKQKPNWASNKDLSDLVKYLEARAKLADEILASSIINE